MKNKLIVELTHLKVLVNEYIVDESKKHDISVEIDKIIEAYEKDSNDRIRKYWLSAVCLGFSRYFDESFDELNFNWRRIKILYDAVEKLVLLAVKILQVMRMQHIKAFKCGKHEDSACTIGLIRPKYIISQPLKHPYGALLLSPGDAESFLHQPVPVILPEGSKIQRVIANNKCVPYGRWWKLDHNLPNSLKEWRQNYAILKMWNKDSFFVNLELREDIPVWVGLAAAQKVVWVGNNGSEISENCILKGGAVQILLDPDDIKHYSDKSQPTNW